MAKFKQTPKKKPAAKSNLGMSIAEYADHRGCSKGSVQTALRYGRIVKNQHGKIDPKEADRMWAENTRSRPLGVPDGRSHRLTPHGSGNGSGHLSEEEQRVKELQISKMTVDTLKARMQLDEAQGRLIDKEAAGNLLFVWCRTERDSWLAFPARFAAVLAEDSGADTGRLTRSLDKYVRIYLRELASAHPPPTQINNP